MQAKNKLIPAHKRMAMGGKPYKKGGLVSKAHEKAESAAYERKEEKCAKASKKGRK